MDTHQTMAALTPDEWNAAYFLGLESIFRRDCKCNVPEQVAEGARILAAAGYRFRHFDPDRDPTVHGYRTPDGGLERPCKEIAAGSFDMVPRARTAVHWLQAHAPEIDTRWLVELIGVYDQLHAEPDRETPPGDDRESRAAPPPPTLV